LSGVFVRFRAPRFTTVIAALLSVWLFLAVGAAFFSADIFFS
jgi:hypothetical protein